MPRAKQISGVSACVNCERKTRPPTADRRNYPGTVARASFGLCSACYQKAAVREKFRPKVEEPEYTPNTIDVWTPQDRLVVVNIAAVVGAEQAVPLLKVLGLLDEQGNPITLPADVLGDHVGSPSLLGLRRKAD